MLNIIKRFNRAAAFMAAKNSGGTTATTLEEVKAQNQSKRAFNFILLINSPVRRIWESIYAIILIFDMLLTPF